MPIKIIRAGDVLPAPKSLQGAVLVPLGGAMSLTEAGELCRLAEGLGPRGRRVLLELAARLHKGAKLHGDFETRDWRKERSEELLDAMVYEVAEVVCPKKEELKPIPYPYPKPAAPQEPKPQFKAGDWVRVIGGHQIVKSGPGSRGSVCKLKRIDTEYGHVVIQRTDTEGECYHCQDEVELWAPRPGELVKVTLAPCDAFTGWVAPGEVVRYLGDSATVPCIGGKYSTRPPIGLHAVRRVGRTDNRQALGLLKAATFEPYFGEELPGQDGFLSDGKTPWIPKAGQRVKVVAAYAGYAGATHRMGQVIRPTAEWHAGNQEGLYEYVCPHCEYSHDTVNDIGYVRVVPADEPKRVPRQFPRDGMPPVGMKVRITGVYDTEPAHKFQDVVTVNKWSFMSEKGVSHRPDTVCLINESGVDGTHCICEEVI